jgi:hypothetical protein
LSLGELRDEHGLVQLEPAADLVRDVRAYASESAQGDLFLKVSGGSPSRRWKRTRMGLPSARTLPSRFI